MGLRIIKDAENNYSVMYCSTSMECFGPVFYEDEDIQDFLDWYGKEDPRSLTQSELTNKVNEWRYLVEPEPKLKNDFLGLSELFNNINIRP